MYIILLVFNRNNTRHSFYNSREHNIFLLFYLKAKVGQKKVLSKDELEKYGKINLIYVKK